MSSFSKFVSKILITLESSVLAETQKKININKFCDFECGQIDFVTRMLGSRNGRSTGKAIYFLNVIYIRVLGEPHMAFSSVLKLLS